MTQDDYKLWTGQSAAQYTQDQWTKLVDNASRRLASFLCLDALPTIDGAIPADLQEVLANFLNAIIAGQGRNAEVESKSVRNFTINFKTEIAANAFAQIAGQYGDIIEGYSNCNSGVIVERSADYHCGHGCSACGGR